MGDQSVHWTDERVELLKKLWADGLSAQQIAAELGGITRNNVVAKIRRLGLSAKAPTTPPLGLSGSLSERDLRADASMDALASSTVRHIKPINLPSPTEPFVVMIAGPNGAGKTSLTEFLQNQQIDFGEYINPDDIAARLFGSAIARAERAQRIADDKRNACIEEKRSFSFETVMSHPSKIDTLLRAKAAGFFIQLFFVGTEDPLINVERVELRVLKGGLHPVWLTPA
jgi:hypothetical protein